MRMLFMPSSAWQTYDTSVYPSRRTRHCLRGREVCMTISLMRTHQWSTVCIGMLTFCRGVCSVPPCFSPSISLHEGRPLVHLPIRHLPATQLRVQRTNTILGLVAGSCRPVRLASVRGLAGVRAGWNGGLRFLPRRGLYCHHRRFCPVHWKL